MPQSQKILDMVQRLLARLHFPGALDDGIH
jgi:hypothetical protein